MRIKDIKRYSIFEYILFDFIYFSMNKDSIRYIEDFPLIIHPTCNYMCNHHDDYKCNKMIYYVLEELFR